MRLATQQESMDNDRARNSPLVEWPGISTVSLLVGILGVGLLGFVPSYFLVLDSTSLTMHLHAFFMYVWLGGLVCMAVLIRTGRYSWHRRIGYASPLIVIAMLYSGVIVTIESLSRYPELNLSVLGVKRLPVMTLSVFCFLYMLGLIYRKQPQAHYRFMLSTGIVIIGPALRRLLLLIPLTKPAYITISFLLLGGLTLGLIALDIRKGYVKTPYFLTLVLLGLMLFGAHYWWAVLRLVASLI